MNCVVESLSPTVTCTTDCVYVVEKFGHGEVMNDGAVWRSGSSVANLDLQIRSVATSNRNCPGCFHASGGQPEPTFGLFAGEMSGRRAVAISGSCDVCKGLTEPIEIENLQVPWHGRESFRQIAKELTVVLGRLVKFNLAERLVEQCVSRASWE